LSKTLRYGTIFKRIKQALPGGRDNLPTMVYHNIRPKLQIHLDPSYNTIGRTSIRIPIDTRIHSGAVPFPVILLRYLEINSGFTLVNTYVAGSAYSSALFSFLIIVFTIQYYFIIRSFWIGVGLGNDEYKSNLVNGEFQMLRLLSNDYRIFSSFNTNVGMTEAIVCAMSMLVAYMALAGRIAGFQVFILCFFGVFFYNFNEIIIWRHAISDTGYTLRLFLFGSSFGLATAFILRFKDRIATTDTLGYFASRHTRAYGLVGACFVWLFLPILSCVGNIFDPVTSGAVISYLPAVILNLWMALSGSCTASFCVSILLGRKIHPHDIVFSSFTVIIFINTGRYRIFSNIHIEP